jgi:ATP-dependent helicase/nuclease subunit A
VGCSEEEIEAAEVTVAAALEHPLLQRAAKSAASGGLRRESPVLLRREDDSLAEGVVDLAFREQGEAEARWTVVDFKTDRELGARRAEYEAQVKLYAEAISVATGEAAEPILLLL